MVEAWRAEGVDCALVLRHPTRLAGVYGISVNQAGERSFSYWRDQSAARTFFDCPGADEAATQAIQADLFFLSAITLAVLAGEGRAKAVELARAVRDRGGRVAFDPNFRARLWQDAASYREAIGAIAPHVDIALPSFDDEAQVWGDRHPDDCLARWRSYGIDEVVVKDGERGALCADGRVAAAPVAKVVDTTGAGDSFNAGYLAQRLAGAGVAVAAGFGARLAACVVQHGGAIVPRAVMADLMQDDAS